jgi:DNA repair protein RadD
MQLFDDQLEVLEKVRQAFKEGHRAVLLYAPTGAGKTECAISMLEATAKNFKRSAMVLDRIVLVNQTSERLQKYSIDHGVLQSGHWRHRPYERIQVCSAQTLEKRGSFPGLDLGIIDECHTIRKQTTEFIRSNEKIRFIGLSASPFAGGLSKTYTKVVSATTTEKLVEKKRLVPLRVFIAKEIDMTGAKKVAGEWSQGDAAERGMKITGDVVTEWVKKTTEIYGGPKKTIVFCSNVAHGADLAQKFAEAGYNFVAISYKDSDEFKVDAVADFSKPDTKIHGLIACDILTKGFDVSDVCIGVSARPFTKSFSSHVQQMGRVMRAHEDKDFALWLDHSGNYVRFQEDWDDLYSEGVRELKDDREKPKKEKTDLEKKQAKCPACGALWIGRSDNCVSCGYHRPMQSLVQAVPGEMEELKGAEKKEDKQRWYSELLDMQGTKSSGWVAHKYKERFGVWPRGLNDVAIPASLEVRRWVTSRQIAWAKSRKAA